MNLFTDVYSSMIDLLRTRSLDGSWQEIEFDLKALCQDDGPNAWQSESLQKVRKKIDDASGFLDAITFSSSSAHADEILKAAQTSKAGFQKRAAMVKTFQHFYYVSKKGNQVVWVVDHPKAYTKWTFDEFDGKSEESLKPLLKKNSEVFGEANRKLLSDSLQLTRKWSQDVVYKLGNPDSETKAVVKRWFHLDNATDDQVQGTAATLLEGFKKVSNACNSTSIIFSDRPHLRASGKYDSTFASVNKGDTMPVVYIYQLFLKTGKRTWFGNIPKLWLCALTIVHELSHKLVATEDIHYDYEGLKPGTSITPSDALKNADSWAYFCANLVGVLSKSVIKDVLK